VSLRDVYIVTSGSYSDYTIDSVFSTIKRAKEYIGNSDWFNIEKHSVDFEQRTVADGFSTYLVEMYKDGEVFSCDYGLRFAGIGWTFMFSYDDDPNLKYISLAKTKEAAIKATNELRAQLIALNRWGIDPWDYEKFGLEKLDE